MEKKKKTKRKYKEGTVFLNEKNNTLFILSGAWWDEEKSDFCYDCHYINSFNADGDPKVRRYWEGRLSKEFKLIESKLARMLYDKKM